MTTIKHFGHPAPAGYDLSDIDYDQCITYGCKIQIDGPKISAKKLTRHDILQNALSDSIQIKYNEAGVEVNFIFETIDFELEMFEQNMVSDFQSDFMNHRVYWVK